MTARREQHLFLIGPRGSGKTTVGRLVAALLGRPHIDLDQWITRQAGQTIGALFAQSGEPVFRDWETRGLIHLTSDANELPSVISLGGGACQRAENRARIRQSGRTAWLRAAAPVLLDRLRGDRDALPDQRPRLTAMEEIDELELLVRARRPGYEQCADYAVDTDEIDAATAARQIVEWWRSVDK